MPKCEGQKGPGNTKSPSQFSSIYRSLTVGCDWDTQIKVRRETYSHQRDDSEAFAEQVKEDKQNELMNTTSSFTSSGETLLSSSFIQ